MEDQILGILTTISDAIWGLPLIILLVGTGLFLTFRLAFIQFRMLPYALRIAFSPKQDKNSKGDISHYQALTTALSATVGTGNIAGVATAIVAGGPGALFWMWMTALVGMATKYAEALLAVKYRVVDKNGQMAGGPMYYIERGLGWKWLGVLFAIFGALAAFGIGNLVQVNSIAEATYQDFHIPQWIVGVVLTIFIGIVVLGGIKSIGRVTAFFVPIMAIFYTIGGLIVIFNNLELVPAAFELIFQDAFTGSAVAGGLLGETIRQGVARGLFSNEAGLGSAPIAAAAAKTDYPARQALVSMTQVFIDTILICTVTGLVIIMGGIYTGGLDGAQLTSATFGGFLGTTGSYIVTIGLIFFASSTVLGWSYYGEKCFQYLFTNDRAIYVYRTIFVLMVFVGSVVKIDIVWTLADILNGLMAFPNLIGLLGLSGIVALETKQFMKIREQERLGRQLERQA